MYAYSECASSKQRRTIVSIVRIQDNTVLVINGTVANAAGSSVIRLRHNHHHYQQLHQQLM